jgi:polyribonucleotide nucleotidyltransferase
MSKKKNKMQKMFYGKTEGGNRTINLQFRVTEEELKQIEKRQAEVGILNRSSYLRKMALNGICIRVEAQYLREASSLLWRISNNMNQYAKKANTTGSIYLEDIHSMKTKYDELIQVYGNVLQQFNEIAEAIY